MDALKILNDWFRFCEFDPNKDAPMCAGKMSSYELDKENKFMIELQNNYDTSGILALMHCRRVARAWFSSVELSLLQVFEQEKSVAAAKKLYQDMNSEEIIRAEQGFTKNLFTSVMRNAGYLHLQESTDTVPTELIISCITDVVKVCSHLRRTVFRKGTVAESLPLCRVLKVYPSMAAALLESDSWQDGIRLIYVSNGGSCDGYFAYIIKSGGALVSFDERLCEKYPGQHRRCSARNSRYSEAKLYELFPYDDLFSYGGYDCKGVATEHKISVEQIDIAQISESAFIKIVLSVHILCSKLCGSVVDSELSYIDILLPCNTQKLIETSTSAELILLRDSSIVVAHKDISLSPTKEQVLGTVYGKELDAKGLIFYVAAYQSYVDAYGTSWEYDPEELLHSPGYPRLTSGVSGIEMDFEFVGTEAHMRAVAFYKARRSLAAHIESCIDRDFRAFGGEQGLREWYLGALRKNHRYLFDLYNKILKRDEALKGTEKGQYAEDVPVVSICEPPEESRYQAKLGSCQRSGRDAVWNMWVLNGVDPDRRNYLPCPFCHATNATRGFAISPMNWKELEVLTGGELPAFLRGWFHPGYSAAPYAGNCLLDRVDMVGELHPDFFAERRCRMEFSEWFSNKGIKKLQDGKYV